MKVNIVSRKIQDKYFLININNNDVFTVSQQVYLAFDKINLLNENNIKEILSNELLVSQNEIDLFIKTIGLKFYE